MGNEWIMIRFSQELSILESLHSRKTCHFLAFMDTHRGFTNTSSITIKCFLLRTFSIKSEGEGLLYISLPLIYCPLMQCLVYVALLIEIKFIVFAVLRTWWVTFFHEILKADKSSLQFSFFFDTKINFEYSSLFGDLFPPHCTSCANFCWQIISELP